MPVATGTEPDKSGDAKPGGDAIVILAASDAIAGRSRRRSGGFVEDAGEEER